MTRFCATKRSNKICRGKAHHLEKGFWGKMLDGWLHSQKIKLQILSKNKQDMWKVLKSVKKEMAQKNLN